MLGKETGFCGRFYLSREIPALIPIDNSHPLWWSRQMRRRVNNFFYLCHHQTLPISPLGTGPWTYLLFWVQGEIRAGWADSLSCPCALCSCKPSLLFSYSEAVPPEWHTRVPGALEQQTPYCVLEGLLLSGPYYSSPSQSRYSLFLNHIDLFSISENTKMTPIGRFLHLLFPLPEMLFL